MDTIQKQYFKYLDYDDMKKRAVEVIKWWQNTKLDPGSNLTHETNSRCGDVNRWLQRLEEKEEDRTADNRIFFIRSIYAAEVWIRALQYKGNA